MIPIVFERERCNQRRAREEKSDLVIRIANEEKTAKMAKAKSVLCEYCNAPVGERCRTGTRYKSVPHKKRIYAAERAEYEKKLADRAGYIKYERLISADNIEELVKFAAKYDKESVLKIIKQITVAIGSDESTYHDSDVVGYLLTSFVKEI